MSSLRYLALLTVLSATAVSAGTLKVVNKCDFDVKAYDLRGPEEFQTLSAGGGTSNVVENSSESQGFQVFRDDVYKNIQTNTQINEGGLLYEVYYSELGNPFDIHLSLSTDDAACPPITSDENLDIDSYETTSKWCGTGASVTLTLCD